MAVAISPRRAHQRRVTALLESLEERRWHVEVLRAAGVQPAGLRDLQREIDATRTRLDETVAGQAGNASVRSSWLSSGSRASYQIR